MLRSLVGSEMCIRDRRDYESAVKLSQVMGSFIRSKDKYKPPMSKKEDLADNFQPLYHKKVKYLVSQLQDHGVQWTESKELVLPNGHVISNSNIVDLIKKALVGSKTRQRTNPTGWKDFLKLLSSLNFPKSFLAKKTTLHDLANLPTIREWETY